MSSYGSVCCYGMTAHGVRALWDLSPLMFTCCVDPNTALNYLAGKNTRAILQMKTLVLLLANVAESTKWNVRYFDAILYCFFILFHNENVYLEFRWADVKKLFVINKNNHETLCANGHMINRDGRLSFGAGMNSTVSIRISTHAFTFIIAHPARSTFYCSACFPYYVR